MRCGIENFEKIKPHNKNGNISLLKYLLATVIKLPHPEVLVKFNTKPVAKKKAGI